MHSYINIICIILFSVLYGVLYFSKLKWKRYVGIINSVLIYSLLNKILHEEFNFGFWNALLIFALYISLIGLIIKAIEKKFKHMI